MNTHLLFLLPDEKPPKLLFVCPICERQNSVEATTELAHLFCRGCGSEIDCSQCELEVLASGRPPEVASHFIAF